MSLRTSTAPLKNISRQGKFFVNLFDLMSKFIFLELKAFFANVFLKDSSVSVISIYLHYLGVCSMY